MSNRPAPGRRNPLEPVEEAQQLIAQRARPRSKKTRDRSWDAQRSKATYDLPTGLIERIREISEEMASQHNAKVKVSDVARLFLEAGLARYDAGELTVELKPVSFTLYDD